MTPPAASARPQPLPRGRHGLAPEDVRASQHARLTEATLQLVARQGYAATTIAQIAAEARVSPNRFYDFFENKLACFLDLCDQCGTELLREIRHVDAPDWRAAVRRSTQTYLEWWRDHPEFTRAYLLELPNAGDASSAQRERIYERFRVMFAEVAGRARAEEPDLPPFSPLVARVLVAGITDIVSEEVRQGRTDRLPRMADQLARLIVTLIVEPS